MAMIANQSSMLILQETRIDLVWSLVVYELVDNLARHVVMNGVIRLMWIFCHRGLR
ncbi:hypothetical protein Hanom_Chr03g00205891 [Helianthus anomalus]